MTSNIILASKSEVRKKILNKNEILDFQNLVLRVPVAKNVIDYAVRLVSATRPNQDTSFDFIQQWVDWGAGPRASQYLILGAKARAVLQGRASQHQNASHQWHRRRPGPE